MKRLLRLLSVLPLLCACSPNEVKEVTDESVVSFASRMETKAIESNLNQKGKTFGVFATKSYDGETHYPVFNNQKVAYQEEGWSYSPLRYWDKEADYEFQAIYPYRETGISRDEKGNLRIEEINVLEGGKGQQTDWLMATDYSAKGAHTNISFTFKHLLTNVNITIQKKDWDGEVILESFRFTGMKTAGAYDEGTSSHWSVSGDNYAGDFFQLSQPIALSEEKKAVSLFSNVLMIPQSISGAMKFQLTYKYDNILYTKEIILALRGYEAPWTEGTRIRYGLIITPENILFEPITITPWVEGEGENIPILPQ